MDNQLLIPKKIKIGFQNRTDTYTGKLAYVTYFDLKGVLRKEKSWEGWRDKKIDPQEFDNEPTTGFVINKNVERYGWSSFSSDRSYIRIFDPRGFEFEITPENLIGILMTGDCSRRTLDGEFVYSWSGKELVLLPCAADEYQTSSKYTSLQTQKIGAKNLKEGATYTTKKMESVVYVGRFERYPLHPEGNSNFYVQKPEKNYVFVSRLTNNFVFKKDVSFLATVADETCATDFAELVERWHGYSLSSPIKELVFEQIQDRSTVSVIASKGDYGLRVNTGNLFVKRGTKFENVLAFLSYDQKTFKLYLTGECWEMKNEKLHTLYSYEPGGRYLTLDELFDKYTVGTLKTLHADGKTRVFDFRIY